MEKLNFVITPCAFILKLMNSTLFYSLYELISFFMTSHSPTGPRSLSFIIPLIRKTIASKAKPTSPDGSARRAKARQLSSRQISVEEASRGQNFSSH